MANRKPTTIALQRVKATTAERADAAIDVHRARQRELDAVPAQRAAIIDAVKAGVSRHEIASAANLTEARISQIVTHRR